MRYQDRRQKVHLLSFFIFSLMIFSSCNEQGGLGMGGDGSLFSGNGGERSLSSNSIGGSDNGNADNVFSEQAVAQVNQDLNAQDNPYVLQADDLQALDDEDLIDEDLIDESEKNELSQFTNN